MIRKIFVNMKKGTEFLNYGRHIISEWGGGHLHSVAASQRELHLLDIGCGHGTDLFNIRDDFARRGDAKSDGVKLHLHGIENYEPYVLECRAKGIDVHSIDIEHDPFPAPAAKYDLVVANQVLEHTKEIFWIFSEVSRTLRPGGRFIVGVPNLASLHNRLLLLFGLHPTAQQSMSAHVRTFTAGDLQRFAETGGFFRTIARRGSNFYPFPPILARPLAVLFPGMAWGLFMVFERTGKPGEFIECLHGEEVLETPYYGGPQNLANPSGKEPTRSKRSTRSSTATSKRASKKRGAR